MAEYVQLRQTGSDMSLSEFIELSENQEQEMILKVIKRCDPYLDQLSQFKQKQAQTNNDKKHEDSQKVPEKS